MPGKKNYHVVPNPSGGWDVKREGADRASSHHDRKTDAIEAGRELAKKAGCELVIHNKDGKISDKESYGRDPFPPRDKKH